MALTNNNDSTVYVNILSENFELYFKYFKQAKPYVYTKHFKGRSYLFTHVDE